jgi:hypothetical protein
MCPECGVEVVGGDPQFVCLICDEPLQLHPNCCLKISCDVYCNAHISNAGSDE